MKRARTMTKSKLRLAAAVRAFSLGAIADMGRRRRHADACRPGAYECAGATAGRRQRAVAAGAVRRSLRSIGRRQSCRRGGAQHEQAQDANIATLNQRANELEDRFASSPVRSKCSITASTSSISASTACRRISTTSSALYRRQQPGAAPCGRRRKRGMPPAAYAPAARRLRRPGVTHLAPPPGVLGTLRSRMPRTRPRHSLSPRCRAAGSRQRHACAVRSRDESARQSQQYDEASGALRAPSPMPIPKDALTPQALYWVGDIAYVQKDYPTAAHTFAEELKKYPKQYARRGEHAEARPGTHRDEPERQRLHGFAHLAGKISGRIEDGDRAGRIRAQSRRLPALTCAMQPSLRISPPPWHARWRRARRGRAPSRFRAEAIPWR